MKEACSKVIECKSLWKTAATIVFTLMVVGACSPATPGADSQLLNGVDETVDSNEEGVSGPIPVGSQLRTTANLNFRTGPSSGYKVMRVLAKGTIVETVEQTDPSNSYYKIKHNGTVGWAHGGYMSVVSTPSSGQAGVSGSVAVGTVLETVTNLNFRSGPSTSYSVLAVLVGGTQVTAIESDPQNSYYKIEHEGMQGWSHGGYMRIASDASGDDADDPAPVAATAATDAAITRAKAGVGSPTGGATDGGWPLDPPPPTRAPAPAPAPTVPIRAAMAQIAPAMSPKSGRCPIATTA